MRISEIPNLPEAFRNKGFVTIQPDSQTTYTFDTSNGSIILERGSYVIDKTDQEIFVDLTAENIEIFLDPRIEKYTVIGLNKNQPKYTSSFEIVNSKINYTPKEIVLTNPKYVEKSVVPSVDKGSSPSKINLKNF